MKKLNFVLAIVTAFVMLSTTVYAKDCNFIWNMDPQPVDLVGYKIYQVGHRDIITINDPSARSYDGDCNLGDGNECFYITAYDATQESDPSDYSCADVKPGKPTVFKFM